MLKVTSAAGVRRLRGLALPLDSIGRMFDAGTVVTGSIASSGDRLRISYEMADPVSGVQLASGNLERPISDLFRLQRELATQIADALRREVGREVVLRDARSRAHNVEAWERVQRAGALQADARDLIQENGVGGAKRLLTRADSILASAESLDARWIDPVLSRASVAYNQAILVRLSGGPESAAARYLDTGLAHVSRALALDPGDPRARATRGLLRYTRWSVSPAPAPDSLALAESDLQSAVDADPSLARAWYTLSQLYHYTGRFSEAQAAATRALEADAWLTGAPRIVSQLYFTALNSGQYEDARHWCEEGRRRFSGDVNFTDCGLRALGWLGEGSAAVRQAGRELDSLEQIAAGQPVSAFTAERRLLYAAVLARSGMRDSARQVLRGALEWSVARLAPDDRAYLDYPASYVYLLLGEPDTTLSLLRRYLSGNVAARSYVGESPWFRDLRGEARFREIVGLPSDAP